ncbi:hypothetical protein UlMin_024554 [Ulmus minor]
MLDAANETPFSMTYGTKAWFYVCSPWLSNIKDNQNKAIKSHKQQVPMLIVPDENKHIWRVYNVMNNKFLDLNLFVPHDTCFCASSEGWLVTVNKDYGITLYKPTFMIEEGNISGNKIIQLPSLSSLDPMEVCSIGMRRTYIKKIAISTIDSIENLDDFEVAVIYGEYLHLASIRPTKDNKWTRVVDTQTPLHDIMYHNNQFYAVHISGKMVCFNVRNSINLNIKTIVENFPIDEEISIDDQEREFLSFRYLVESYGELLLVERYWNNFESDHITVKFKIFKLNLDGLRWVKIKSLGDVALFLGNNSSLSVIASNFDKCQPNCIYFTHHEDELGYGPHGPSDMGIYNIESGSFTWNFTMNLDVIAKMDERPPIWLLPKISAY